MKRIFYIVFMLMEVFAGKAFAQTDDYVPHIILANGELVPLTKEGKTDSTSLPGVWTVKDNVKYKDPVSVIITKKIANNHRVTVFDTSETILEYIDPDYLQKFKTTKTEVTQIGGKKSKVIIRDHSSLPPVALLIVDDKPVDIEFLSKIDPTQILKMDVLKGDKATQLYGYQGSYGVILVTTKNKKKTKN